MSDNSKNYSSGSGESGGEERKSGYSSGRRGRNQKRRRNPYIKNEKKNAATTETVIEEPVEKFATEVADDQGVEADRVIEDAPDLSDGSFSEIAEEDGVVFGADNELEYSVNETAESGDDATSEPEETKASYEIAGVSFKKTSKIYYFDVDGNDLKKDMHVIVETARGLEYGTVVFPYRVVTEREVVLPLRKIVRIASEQDEQHYHDNAKREIEAFNSCVEKIAAHNLEMKLVDVEFTFDNSKLLFYFTSDGRVDFRDLVKDLASIFRTRIELRQIGIRDEAKLMGGLGICGRPFCCHSFLSDFVQVSIKMAKEQNLSLNSSKISGACGRLMCCLRYEYDVYNEEIRKTPKTDSVVVTEDGEGIIKETMPLAGLVKVQVFNKNDISMKVYDRDAVTVVKGKSAKAFLQEMAEKREATEKTERPRRPLSPKLSNDKKSDSSVENRAVLRRRTKENKVSSIDDLKPESPEATAQKPELSVHRSRGQRPPRQGRGEAARVRDASDHRESNREKNEKPSLPKKDEE